MARLRKPSPVEEAVFIPPPPNATRPTRSSPRKITSDSPSTRKLRYTSSQDSDEDSFLVPKVSVSQSPVRKRRVLRPMASNASLAIRPSDESLRSLAATPDKDRRQRRPLREGGHAANYLYSKTLAKSVARRKGPSNALKGEDTAATQTFIDDRDVERSIICDDENEPMEEYKENATPVAEDTDSEMDEEPLINTRVYRQQRRARPVLSDSEDEYEDAIGSPHTQSPVIEPPQSPSKMMPPPPLISNRPQHQKAHTAISSWTQNVIDLTNSSIPPTAFVLPPPARARTASFAASSGASSRTSNRVDDILV